MPEYNELKAVGVKRSWDNEHLYVDMFKTSITLTNYSGIASIPTTASTFITAHSYRDSLLIRNVSTGVVYIKLGTGATTGDMPLYPDEVMVISDYNGVVSGITTGSSKNVSIIELFIT